MGGGAPRVSERQGSELLRDSGQAGAEKRLPGRGAARARGAQARHPPGHAGQSGGRSPGDTWAAEGQKGALPTCLPRVWRARAGAPAHDAWCLPPWRLQRGRALSPERECRRGVRESNRVRVGALGV